MGKVPMPDLIYQATIEKGLPAASQRWLVINSRQEGIGGTAPELADKFDRFNGIAQIMGLHSKCRALWTKPAFDPVQSL
jgi:hypothetical protein